MESHATRAAKPPATSRFSDSIPRPALIRIVVGWLLLLLLMAVNWAYLLASNASRLNDAEAQARQRAAQTAHALALQTNTLIENIDYIAQQLAERWLSHDEHAFVQAVALAQNTLSKDALVQVAVADPRGDVVFSNVDSWTSEDQPRVSIADREHFVAHMSGDPSRLFIGQPVLGRLSQQWTVQFSRPIEHSGQRLGVIVLSVSTEHLSHAFHSIFPDPADVAILLRDDGTYLARSQLLEDVLGKAVPPTRSLILQSPERSGFYDIVAPIDGVERYYAWHRAADYPVVVSLGLDKAKVLATVTDSVQRMRTNNVQVTLLLLLAAAWISRLFLQRSRQMATLAEAGERLELALQGSRLGTWDWNRHTGAMHFNERWAAMFGYSLSELEPDIETWESLVHPDDFDSVQYALDAYLQGQRPFYEVEYRMRHRDGRWIWVLDRGRTVERASHDGTLRMAGTYTDISERHSAEVALATERLRLTTLLQRFPDGVLMEDAEGVVVMANRQFCELAELSVSPDALQGLSHIDLCGRLGERRARWLHVPDATMDGDMRRSIEVNTARGGTLEVDWVPIVSDDRQLGRIWLVRDITVRKQREAALATLATTDVLTGLPNRRSFMECLETVISDPHAHGVLLMLDIDHFKRVNDTYGHVSGDTVLQHIAQIIRANLRQNDTAGRLGGEEFSVLLSGIDPMDAQALAERLREALASTPAITDAGTVHVTTSIGLAVLDGSSAKVLLSRADEALYAAKAAGRNRVCCWPV